MKELLVKLANHARSLDRQLFELAHAIRLDSKPPFINSSPDTSNLLNANPQSEQSEIEDSIDSLTQELKNMSVTRFYKRQLGKSSNFILVQSAMDSHRDVLGNHAFVMTVFTKHRRLEFWKPGPVSLG